MLSMRNIQKVYRTDLIETHALHEFTVDVKAGEFVAIMGRSGSGKTTFLNIAGLLDTFDSGTYHLDGEDVSRLSDGEMSRIRNLKIGFVFQSFNLIPDLDVFDNVDVPLRYRRLPAKERKERIERAAATVGLSARLHHLPSQLSGGQQQRVAIARVLAGDPRLILADEPTGNLDTMMSREMMDLLDKINEIGNDDRHGHARPGVRGPRVPPHPPARRVPRGPRGPGGVRDGRPQPSGHGRDGLTEASMLWHNLRIAWKSLKRNALLTALIISGIALGHRRLDDLRGCPPRLRAASHPAESRHAALRPPGQLGPVEALPGRRPDAAAHPDHLPGHGRGDAVEDPAAADRHGQDDAVRVSRPEGRAPVPGERPARLRGLLPDVRRAVPLRDRAGTARRTPDPEPVVVLASEMNDKLFGGSNSVGKTVRIANRDFRVVGVMGPWQPNVKFYDLTQNAIAEPEKIYMPFNLLKPMQLQPSGNRDGWGPSPSVSGFEGFLVSETCWIQMWVELPDGKAVNDYRDFLTAYVMEQKKTGRFPRPLNNRLSTVKEWMDEQKVVPPQANTMLIVSLLFLAVCAVNLVGLLLGKFLARAPEVSVRRALGATRGDIFLQHVIECEVIGRHGRGRRAPPRARRPRGPERLGQDDRDADRLLPARRADDPARDRALARRRPRRGALSRLADLPDSARRPPESRSRGGTPWNSDRSSEPSAATRSATA